MKKISKMRFVALLLITCFAFMVAGCDLFVRNDAYYYNQVVISVSYDDGSKIEIDRLEYLNAFNSYGQNLMSSYGYEQERAEEETVKALVNRKVLLKEAKRVAETEEGSSIKLTQEETENLYYQVYESLISNVYDYEDEIREDWGLQEHDPHAGHNHDSEDSSDLVVYEPYTKTARPEYDEETGQYRIKLLDTEEKITASERIKNAEAVYERFVAETKNNAVNNVVQEGYRRYLGTLESSQKILGTKYNEKELIEEEIKKAFENLEENKIIAKYQDFKQENNGYSYITVRQVLDKYKSMISSSKFVYDGNEEDFNTDMLENFKNVNYFVNDDYFYVAHILIKFNTEEEARYKELDTLSNNGEGDIISREYYEAEKAKIYNNLMADVRDAETGEITLDVKTANQVLNEVQIALANASTIEQKNEAFRNLMYKYNEDGGIMNADYPYVIGTYDSKMVETFTDASRELHQAGEYGAVSGLVESSYGLHIVYYMGTCENIFEIPEDGKIELRADYKIEDGGQTINYSDVLKLDETYLNGLNNKTVFDLVYESLESDNYSSFENVNIERLKEINGVKVKRVKKLI